MKTKAEQFLDEYTKATDGLTNVHKVLRLLEKYKTKHGFHTASILTRNNERIGKRFVFDDNSFCDFYDESPQKAFTGVNHNFDIKKAH